MLPEISKAKWENRTHPWYVRRQFGYKSAAWTRLS
jgi:hypothetical protein